MQAEKKFLEMIQSPSRLKWACRRGMLELDVLLGNFLENGFPALSHDEKLLFARLLENPDPELFAWLMGAEQPQDKDMQLIIGKMRHHAKS